jgi:hypothetical protein
MDVFLIYHYYSLFVLLTGIIKVLLYYTLLPES